MKIHVLSDLHTEFEPFDPPATDADVVVLAGDVAVGMAGLEAARDWFPDTPVVYVAGNHEHYREAIPRLAVRMGAAARDAGIHFLENAATVIGGVRFLGCTLWTDFDLLGERGRCMEEAAAVMNDFRLIRVSPEYRRFKPRDAREVHGRSLRWLLDELDAPFDGPTVVVTHHAPGLRSCDPRYHDHPATAAYASDLEWLLDGRIDLWVHGHTHCCVDYDVGGTRVVANQRGYPDDRCDGFDPGLVVELTN